MATEQEEEDIQYMKSLGVSGETLTSLSLLDKKNFGVIELPFSTVDSLKQSAEISTTIGDNTLTISLRKRLTDGVWFATETGTIAGEDFYHCAPVYLDTLRHCTKSFCIVFVSPYAFSEDMTEGVELSVIQNLSILAVY